MMCVVSLNPTCPSSSPHPGSEVSFKLFFLFSTPAFFLPFILTSIYLDLNFSIEISSLTLFLFFLFHHFLLSFFFPLPG